MADSDPRIGTILQDRYKILAPLGQGGMGVVYRGERVGLGRQVAIKFLQAQLSGHDELRKRFEREARAMSRLSHPHCVPVIDFGIVDDVPYIVLELVPGRSMREIMNEGRVTPLRAVRLIRQILAGLAHAHQLGIVHRDVKPANVVVSDAVGAGDQARILDFGLAKIIEGNPMASVSAANVAIGTPAYMSPEQGRGQPVDFRADIYATGVLLFELLTGKKPFVGKDLFETLKLHETAPTPSLFDSEPELPRELQPVIEKAMAKRPEDRFQDAVSFAEALAPIELDLVSGRKPIGLIESSRPVRDAEPRPASEELVERRGGWGWLFALLIMAGGLGALWHFRQKITETIFGPAEAVGDAGVADAAVDELIDEPIDAAPVDAAPPDARPPDAAPIDAAPIDAAPVIDAARVDDAAVPAPGDAG